MSAIQVSEDTVLILWTNKQIINQVEVTATLCGSREYAYQPQRRLQFYGRKDEPKLEFLRGLRGGG